MFSAFKSVLPSSKDEKISPIPALNTLFADYDNLIKRLDAEFIALHQNQTNWESKGATFNFFTGVAKALNAQTELFKRVIEDLESQDTSHDIEESKRRLVDLAGANKKLQEDYRISALERGLKLNPPILSAENWARMQERGTFSQRVEHSFQSAHYTLAREDLANQMGFPEMILALNLYGDKGAHNTAGREICGLVCQQVVRRIEQNQVNEFNNDVALIKAYFAQHAPAAQTILQQELNLSLQQKATAFKKIYHALRDGDTRWFKTNFLTGKEAHSDEQLVRQVLEHVRLKPNSRSAQAWELVNRHYRNCNKDNESLMRETHQIAFKNSGFFAVTHVTGISIFKQSTLQAHVAEVNGEKIEQANLRQGSRMHRVYSAMNR